MTTMRIILLLMPAILCAWSAPAFACKELARYQEHLYGFAPGWWSPYRVVEIVEAGKDEFTAILKRNFADKTDSGGRHVTLRFIPNEEAHAMCSISLEVGQTYLVRTTRETEPLMVSRFNWYNIPHTHQMYDSYLSDLEKAEIRDMYVEADAVTYDSPNNRLILNGRVSVDEAGTDIFAKRLVYDRNTNELVAEDWSLRKKPDNAYTRGDRFRLDDNYRDRFLRVLAEFGPAIRHYWPLPVERGVGVKSSPLPPSADN